VGATFVQMNTNFETTKLQNLLTDILDTQQSSPPLHLLQLFHQQSVHILICNNNLSLMYLTLIP
jgi:hypothetical protein